MPKKYPRTLNDGRIQCRVKIAGFLDGRPFEYTDPPDRASQFISPDGDPSTYWWNDGNFSCDCNRAEFLPKEWEFPEHICGDRILIDSIEPLDPNLPSLHLRESTKGKS